MKALLSMVAVVTLILVGEGPAHGQTKTKCRRQCGKATTKSYDLAVSSVSGDQIRGPATVRADNLNVLRYEYKFNLAIAFSAAPDLWAKLQSAAAPAPSPAPEKPITGSAQRPPPPRHVSNKSQQSIIDQAEALIRDAGVAMAAADDAIAAAAGRADVRDCLGIPQDVDTSKETNVQADCLADLVTRSVTAVAQVKAGGQALVALLQAKWNKPDLLVSFINGELSATSTFTKAITAEWPNPNTTATLKRIAQAWKTELASRASKFSDSLPSISGSLVSAKRPLTDIQQTLIIKAKAASGDDQKALTDEASNVQRAVESLDDKVKQLSKTTTLLNWATGENQRVLGVIPDLELSSSKYSDFQTAQGALQGWKTRMTELSNSWNTYVTAKTQGKSEEENPSPFSLSAPPAGCDFAFSRTKTTAITLTRADLMPGTTAAAPETALSVTVECTSPFAVSAGVAFSSIEKHEFAIQPSPTAPPATGTVNKFVVTNNSNFHPLPLGMIHARLCEFNEKVALHVTFGLAGNFQSQNAGGSSAEFLIGPSFSLFRTMFFTPGLHIGTKTRIGGGFNVGDAVPSNITTVPLQKSYTTGFGVAITFTKP